MTERFPWYHVVPGVQCTNGRLSRSQSEFRSAGLPRDTARSAQKGGTGKLGGRHASCPLPGGVHEGNTERPLGVTMRDVPCHPARVVWLLPIPPTRL